MYTPRNDSEAKVLAEIKTVMDPDLSVSLYDLGLIYEMDVKDSFVDVKMTLTSMGCPAGSMLQEQIADSCRRVDGIEKVNVDIVWIPHWDPKTMATENGKDALGIFDF